MRIALCHATTFSVSSVSAPPLPTVDEQPETGTDTDNWAEIRGDADIQFAPIEMPPPRETPGWLKALQEFIDGLFAPLGNTFGSAWPFIKWGMIALCAAMVLYILYRLLAPMLDLPKRGADEPEDWVPEERQARALLEDADALAAQGKFGEAAHLLLIRSVTHIADARPDWVEPSSTARELATLTSLPDAARSAFGIIAQRVERSLFALHPLQQDDWTTARAAYADFALQNLTRAATEQSA